MEINLLYLKGTYVAEVIADDIVIRTVEDALGLMSDCIYQGARNIIINERNIIPDFFDLTTRLAGDILQKFSNYNVKLAVVGDYSKYHSQSLLDFINESNEAGNINFVKSLTEAKNRLTK